VKTIIEKKKLVSGDDKSDFQTLDND